MSIQLTNAKCKSYKLLGQYNWSNGILSNLWTHEKDQAYVEPGSGSTAVCYKNNTLQYSLDNGQVITIILDRLFPDTGFNIQVCTCWKSGFLNWLLFQPLVAFSVIIAFITIGSSFLDSIFGFAKNIE